LSTAAQLYKKFHLKKLATYDRVAVGVAVARWSWSTKLTYAESG